MASLNTRMSNTIENRDIPIGMKICLYTLSLPPLCLLGVSPYLRNVFLRDLQDVLQTPRRLKSLVRRVISSG